MDPWAIIAALLSALVGVLWYLFTSSRNRADEAHKMISSKADVTHVEKLVKDSEERAVLRDEKSSKAIQREIDILRSTVNTQITSLKDTVTKHWGD